MHDRIIAVYFLSNQKNGTLYMGSTNDLHRRMLEHREGLYRGFSKRYKLKKLVFCQPCPNVATALRLERRYKKYYREWKINLIEENNPNWDDLCERFW
jgi:putative endonuclease